MDTIEKKERIIIQVGTEIESSQFNQMYDKYAYMGEDKEAGGDDDDWDDEEDGGGEKKEKDKKIPLIAYENSTDTLQNAVKKVMPQEWIKEQNDKWIGKGWGGGVDWSSFVLTPDGYVFLEYKSADQKPFGGGPVEKFRCVAEGIMSKEILPSWFVKRAVTDPSSGEYGQGNPKWGTPEEARELLIRLFKESGLSAEDIAS